jgi:hypothetical protein
MEWIDMEVVGILMQIGTVGLIVGFVSVLLTESIKIALSLVFSKNNNTLNRLSWWTNLVLVIIISCIFIYVYLTGSGGAFRAATYVIHSSVTAIIGWILSTLFYRILLEAV